MTRKRFHGLKKVKFRATWNKYNLYNLYRLKSPPYDNKSMTFFQQKWYAKSALRAYHGEQIREKQWQRMFTPQLNSVIPISHKYLAEFDGSELAAGRGSGREEPPGLEPNKPTKVFIPYMGMTFAPIERRLDMAVFRAMFASSVRQARQFVTHRQVKVNGKTMPYPGYLLNPGDMFQVEPERVMFATGKKKESAQARKDRTTWKFKRHVKLVSRVGLTGRTKQKEVMTQKDLLNDNLESEPKDINPRIRRTRNNPELRKLLKKDLESILEQVLEKLTWKRHTLRRLRLQGQRAKAKVKFRDILKRTRKTLSHVHAMPIDSLEKKVKELAEELYELHTGVAVSDARNSPDVNNSNQTDSNSSDSIKKLSPKERELHEKKFEEFKRGYRDNPVDESKPYATPWAPRPYMSPFAFIPRYLEVNHNICSAVYLRHPVARPGLSEVPTPFPLETSQLAFTWYLRRR